MSTPTITHPSIADFRDPQLDGPTPLTKTADGHVYGHLCLFDQAHISFGGQQVFAPRGDDMSYFLTGATDVIDDDGNVVEISVGKLTMGTNHASTSGRLSAREVEDHYSRTGSIAALVNAGNDRWGVWLSGRVMDDLDEFSTRRFRACGASGDWRAIGGRLRLVAALSVPVGGFPVPRARVASGAPTALVAAGTLAPEVSPLAFARRVDPAWQAPAESLTASVRHRFDYDEMAERVAAALEARRKRAELAATGGALLEELDETPARFASLLEQVDEAPARVDALLSALEDDAAPFDWASAGEGETFDVSHMPPQLQEEWLHGKIAARIGWGTDGSYRRCQLIAREKGIGGKYIDGMCASLYHSAVGEWPGRGHK